MTRDLLERTATTTSLLVKEAGLEWSGIDRILLVGGSSRMPMVAEMLERVTGKVPDRSASPDEAIAHGAALYAGMLMQSGDGSHGPACQLVNVNSHSLGVVGSDSETKELVNAILIPKNSPLPCKAMGTFRTAKANQRSVKVSVLEGESHRPSECIELGECVVRDLPPALPKGSKVEVHYSYAANGRISVSARVPGTRHSAHVEIRRDHHAELEDLATWRARLQGKLPPSDQAVDAEQAATGASHDRGSTLRFLNTLYTDIGRAALGQAVPSALHRSLAAAQKADVDGQAARAALANAESAKQHAGSGHHLVQASSAVSRAKTLADQTRSQAEFACLVLGRECVVAGFVPPGMQERYDIALRLRAARG